MKNKKLIYILSFFIPAFIFTLIMMLKHVTPFGHNTVLGSDLLSQYSSFYTELAYKLRHGNSLFYSFTQGLGTDYLNQASYYVISPLNIILIFFNSRTMPIAITILLILKCGLAGLSMSIYIKKHYYSLSTGIDHVIITLCVSTCYALCSYFVNYFQNIIWMDCFLLFPLIILGLEMLVKNRRPQLYSFVLALAIFTNFYIGFMICIYCALYFIHLLINDDAPNKFKTLLRFIVYSALAGGLCSVILIPQVIAMKNYIPQASNFFKGIFLYYPPIVTFFRFMRSATPSFWHYPFFYSTMLVFFILPIFVINKSLSLKYKCSKLILLTFMLLSSQINLLDYLWNGCHKINCYAGRNSFCVIFLVLTICIDTVNELKKISSKALLIIYFITISLFLYVRFYFNYSNTNNCVMNNVLLFTIALIIILIFRNKKYFSLIMATFMFVEIFTSSYDIIGTDKTYHEYLKEYTHTRDLLCNINDNTFYRVKNDTKFTENDGAINNYNSISTYSSSTDFNVEHFLADHGFRNALNSYTDQSFEPVINSMLATKYIISKQQIHSPALVSYYSDDTINIYRNPYSLSIAYYVSSKDISDILSGNNSFDRINHLSQTLIGKNLYSRYNSLKLNPGEDIYIYSNHKLYDATYESDGHSESLYPEYQLIQCAYNTDGFIYHIADNTKGGTLKCNSNLSAEDLYIYTLGNNTLVELMTKLSQYQMDVEHFSSNSFSGTLSSPKGYILTSIPYSKGWTIKIDGKKTKGMKFENALLYFKVESGKHNITISYIPEGFYLGLIVSVLSFCIIVLLYVLKKKNLLLATLR